MDIITNQKAHNVTGCGHPKQPSATCHVSRVTQWPDVSISRDITTSQHQIADTHLTWPLITDSDGDTDRGLGAGFHLPTSNEERSYIGEH